MVLTARHIFSELMRLIYFCASFSIGRDIKCSQQSARERAALWLAVNKLDVLEAAKDAAIKELQVSSVILSS